MRQSITTKYLGPTNARGSRIKAIARKRSRLGAEMSVTVPYDWGSVEHEHCRAACILAKRLGWSGLWIGGGNVDENGYVYVNVADWTAKPVFDSRMVEGADWFYVPYKEA